MIPTAHELRACDSYSPICSQAHGVGVFLKCYDDSQCFGTVISCTFFFFKYGMDGSFSAAGHRPLFNKQKQNIIVCKTLRKEGRAVQNIGKGYKWSPVNAA